MSQRHKYPRTPHLPWSPGASGDDVRLFRTETFEGREVVATEKLDGENTTLYGDGLHARSLESRPHPSRAWVKGMHASIAHLIPAGWRLCGENLYARHSIPYGDLDGYFYLFSAWDEGNRCLGWDETLEWAALLELPVPRTLYRGPWDEPLLRGLAGSLDTSVVEGYVVRAVDGFARETFGERVAKWVRPGHVQTDEHWMHQVVVPNGLRRREPGDAPNAGGG